MRRVSGVAAGLTVLGALSWIAQGFLPLVSSGAFSTSSTLDLARIALAGTTGTLLPPVVAVALLVVPACAVVLLALAPWTHLSVRVSRPVVALLGSACAVLQVLVVVDGDWGRTGVGSLCALSGAALALLGAGLGTLPPHALHPHAPEWPSPVSLAGHHSVTHVPWGESAPPHQEHPVVPAGAERPGGGEP